ncbi:MAG: LytTR family DNA-binding domain-containing protein [Clostridia bacterium]
MYIAICDDTPDELERISALTHEYLTAHSLIAEVATFLHPDLLLQASEKTPFDLYLLDVVMPMLSGIDVGRELREKHSNAQIIYLTTSSEFAVEAFGLRATHYLVKPFQAAQLDEALSRAMEKWKAAIPKELVLKTKGGELRAIDPDQIQYVESHNHDQFVYLQADVWFEVSRSLSWLCAELEALAPRQFISPCKGYLVNQHAISTIHTKGIVLRCGTRIPIVRGAVHKLQAQYMSFLFDRNALPL